NAVSLGGRRLEQFIINSRYAKRINYDFQAVLKPEQKRTDLQETTVKHDKTGYSKTRQKCSYLGFMSQANRRERVPRSGRVRDAPVPTVTKYQANIHNTYRGYVQTHAGYIFAASLSMSPYEPYLVDSVGHVLLVFSISSEPYKFSSPFSMGLLSSKACRVPSHIKETGM
ncbi:hypothetical protein STEG23_035942, partial [Scotinomys teguina]